MLSKCIIPLAKKFDVRNEPVYACDLLKECGFSRTVVYWEGTDEVGETDGEFQPSVALISKALPKPVLRAGTILRSIRTIFRLPIVEPSRSD